MFFILIVGSYVSTQAQISKTSEELDTLAIKAHSYVFLNGERKYFHFDTVLILPYWQTRKLQPGDYTATRRMYQRMKRNSRKSKVKKELFDLFFTIPNYNSTRQKKMDIKEKKDEFAEYYGKNIRNITIKRMKVFGTHFPDTNYRKDTWFNKVGNGLHVSTHRWVIKKNLILKEGDYITVNRARESERLVRKLPYIRDAKIYFLPIENNADQVDMVLVVKDVWSLEVDGSWSGLDDWSLKLDEENFLGFGNELSNKISYDEAFDSRWGYEGRYKMVNIKKTFIDANINFARSEEFKTIGGEIGRQFLSSEFNTAGGLRVEHTDRLNFFLTDESELISFRTKFNFADLWLAQAIDLSSQQSIEQKRLLFGIGASSLHYLESPIPMPDTNQFYANREMILFKAGLNKRSYEKSDLILEYETTEDIPIGHKFDITIGREFGQFDDRWYWGVNFSKGKFIFRKGYLRYDFTFSSFIRDGRQEQGLFRTNFSFFSNLYRRGRYSYRHFLKFGYAQGFDRYDNEYLFINRENGVRGIRGPLLRGDRRLNFGGESVIFTPFHFMGFKVAVFGFAEFAMISDRSGFFSNKLFQGYGVGLRFNNNNLIVDRFELRFGFYPVRPDGFDQNNLDFAGGRNIDLEDFDFQRPQVERFD